MITKLGTYISPRFYLIITDFTLIILLIKTDLRLALLYKVVTGHVGIQAEHVGPVAADNATRAEHQFKFRAVGSST